MSIYLESEGDFKKTEKYLKELANQDFFKKLMEYGEEGVRALSAATPVRTGKTAASWTYEIAKSAEGLSINWVNTNINKGVNVAVILQYGHGTGTGGYVSGIDYINPAMRPVFENIMQSACEEIAKL